MTKKLSYENIIPCIIDLCEKHHIKLVLDDDKIDVDNGELYNGAEIHLGRKYTSNLIFLAIFFHELGHILITRRKSKKYRKLSIFREEALAWCIAMEFQAKYFGKSFTKSQGNFMLECLSSYSKQHYNFSKTYPSSRN